MNKKLLFESEGGNKKKETLSYIRGVVGILIGIFFLFILINDKGGMSQSGYGGTWVYRKSFSSDPAMRMGIIFFAFLFLASGIFYFLNGIASKKSYLKIYDSYIEAKAFDIIGLITGRNKNLLSDIILEYKEIQGVSVKKGMVVLDTYGKNKCIFCPDCNTASQILIEQLNKYKSN